MAQELVLEAKNLAALAGAFGVHRLHKGHLPRVSAHFSPEYGVKL